MSTIAPPRTGQRVRPAPPQEKPTRPSNRRTNHPARKTPRRSVAAEVVPIDANSALPPKRRSGPALETAFVWFAMATGLSLAALTASDLLIKWPFERVNLQFDVGFLISGLLLTYLAHDAKRTNHL